MENEREAILSAYKLMWDMLGFTEKTYCQLFATTEALAEGGSSETFRTRYDRHLDFVEHSDVMTVFCELRHRLDDMRARAAATLGNDL